nr:MULTISPECIES: hypothetical protein [Burkholderia]
MSSRVVACRRVSSRVVACRRVSSRVVACRRVSSRVVACRRVSSRVVACRRVSSRVVACRRGSSRVVAGRRGSSRVVAGRRGSSRVVAGRRGSSRVVAGRRGPARAGASARVTVGGRLPLRNRPHPPTARARSSKATVFLKDSMKKILAVIAFLAVVGWLAATTTILLAPTSQPCTDAWFDAVDKQFHITDDGGHGPDPGSGEWLGAVERKAKLPENDHLPEQQRCEAIQRELSHRTYIVNPRLGLRFSL